MNLEDFKQFVINYKTFDIEERKVTYTIKDWLELRKNTIGY